jgi:hypothetical protein
LKSNLKMPYSSSSSQYTRTSELSSSNPLERCCVSSVSKLDGIPRNWPGKQDRDSLFELRDQLYNPLYETQPGRLDVWEPSLNQKNTAILNQQIYKLGKNVCEYRVFTKTPVLWYY